MENANLKLRGMSCASCANAIETVIRSVPGVEACNVNFGTEQATVKYNPQKTNLDIIKDAVDGAGYVAQPMQSEDLFRTDDDTEQQERLAETQKLIRLKS